MNNQRNGTVQRKKPGDIETYFGELIMALNELQIKEVEQAGSAFLKEKRPPPEIRNQLDLAYRIDGQSVFVYEIRPRWDNPNVIMEVPVAKTTFVKSRNYWKIFWMRADLKWHAYDPVPYVKTIDAFFKLVDEDELGCFFG